MFWHSNFPVIAGGFLMSLAVVSRAAFCRVVAIATLASSGLLSLSSASAFAAVSTTAPPSVEQVRGALGKAPLPWVPNAGQWDAKAAFRAQSFAGSVWMTHDGKLVHQFNGPKVDANDGSTPRHGKTRGETDEREPGWVLTERFVGGAVKRIEGIDPQAAKANYFLAGKPAAADLQSYAELALGEVYPGVTVALKATQANVEKLYTVAPQRDPAVIRMQIDGANALSITADGSLQAATDNGAVAFTPPVAFQHDNAGNKIDVKVAYALDAEARQYGFTVGDYDRSRPLTIDPLLGSSYFGSTDQDVATAMAVHPSSGVVYITGYTFSTDLPVTSGGAQPSRAAGYDAFIARFNPGLTALPRATYFGGNGNDVAAGIAINPNTGNVYITGGSSSSALPGSAGSPQPTAASGNTDGFIAVFNGALDTLIRASFHGGAGDENVNAIAYHPVSGDIYIGGNSAGVNALPGVAGGAQSTSGVGRPDCFVTRFSGDLTQRLQSTYISGSGGIRCDLSGLAVHPISGFVYAVGTTDHPNLTGVASGNQTTFSASSFFRNAFVTRLNANLTTITASTYDSASSGSEGRAIAIHSTTGEVYIAGTGTVPFTAGSAQPGTAGGFISRFSPNLGTRYIATTVGSQLSDGTELNSLVFNAVNGDLYASGWTGVATLWSPASGGVQPAYVGGTADGLVVRINAGLTAFAGATYLGTVAADTLTAIAFNPLTGNVYVAGYTGGDDLPGASIGAKRTNAGSTDAFVSAFTPDLSNFGVTPNPFTFKPRLNVIVGTTHIDGPVQMTGLTAFTNVSITGAQGNVCISSMAGCSCNLSPGGVYGTTGLIANGQYLCVRNVAAAAGNTLSESTILVGGYVTKFMNYTGQLFACTMDIDGDGVYQATTDGAMLTRALLGLTGTAVTNGLVGHNPPRNTWTRIREHLNSNCGMNLAQ
jgi:hypothetical protein